MAEGDKLGLDFQDAFKTLLEGKKMKRAAWSEGKYVEKQDAALMLVDGESKAAYAPEQEDWFASDWMTA